MKIGINGKKLATSDIISWSMLLSLFGYMFSLNFFMPLHRDDYEYALIWGTNVRISAWPDILHSLVSHYLTHGGRMVDFFVLDSFLLWGKQWFNPFNALLFVALVILIYWHSQRNITVHFQPYILALITVFCWFGLPHFAEVAIWMTGACVYLLTAVLIFGFLLPYHFYYIRKPLFADSMWAAIAMLTAGLLAAWTIENTSATLNILVAALIGYAYRQGTLRRWMIAGFIGSVSGFLLLVAAPGNYVRYGDKHTPLLLHVTNTVAGTAEMLLYVLPILLFLLGVWRMLLICYAQRKGIALLPVRRRTTVSFVVLTGLIGVMLVSYLTNSFFSQWLFHAIYDKLIVPWGYATVRLKVQLANTVAGVEEMSVYLLAAALSFQWVTGKWNLTQSAVQTIRPRAAYQEIVNAYPQCRFIIACCLLAAVNQLVMLAAPSFPGRAAFGSSVFLIIGAASVFTIPEVRSYILERPRRKDLAWLMGLAFLPMAAFVLYQYSLIYADNTRRMVYVEQQVNRGAIYLELEPLTSKARVLRHVYFEELNNGVSKGGFCRYYGLQDLKVVEEP